MGLRQSGEAAKKKRAATLRETRSRGTQIIVPHFGCEAMGDIKDYVHARLPSVSTF
jgi:hypothetical protein